MKPSFILGLVFLPALIAGCGDGQAFSAHGPLKRVAEIDGCVIAVRRARKTPDYRHLDELMVTGKVKRVFRMPRLNDVEKLSTNIIWANWITGGNGANSTASVILVFEGDFFTNFENFAQSAEFSGGKLRVAVTEELWSSFLSHAETGKYADCFFYSNRSLVHDVPGLEAANRVEETLVRGKIVSNAASNPAGLDRSFYRDVYWLYRHYQKLGALGSIRPFLEKTVYRQKIAFADASGKRVTITEGLLEQDAAGER